MNITERNNELDKIGTQFNQFIVAVDGALIAYAIKQTENSKLSIMLIPLGLAIISWGLSFYFGITAIRTGISARVADITSSRKDIVESEEFSALADKIFRDLINRGNWNYAKMFQFLYAGGIFYIIWQLIEMCFRTFCK